MNSPQKKVVAQMFQMNMLHHPKPEAACLDWALEVVDTLKMYSVEAVLQAGSASWPRLTPEQDAAGGKQDVTHFTYQWTAPGTIGATKELLEKSLSGGTLPEIHVWAAIKSTHEIVDMTTGYWPSQCQKLIGKDWPGVRPPEYFWGSELPNGVRYTPSLSACRFIELLLLLQKETRRALRSSP